MTTDQCIDVMQNEVLKPIITKTYEATKTAFKIVTNVNQIMYDMELEFQHIFSSLSEEFEDFRGLDESSFNEKVDVCYHHFISNALNLLADYSVKLNDECIIMNENMEILSAQPSMIPYVQNAFAFGKRRIFEVTMGGLAIVAKPLGITENQITKTLKDKIDERMKSKRKQGDDKNED